MSREGVQRDLLPVVEGTTVATKYGPVKTDHILFIAAGAFHVAKPSDLLPELQGRFPIRVELEAPDRGRLRAHPDRAGDRAHQAVRGAALDRGRDAALRAATRSREIARLAVEVNSRTENIGARRLATLLERLLDEVSFEAPDMAGRRAHGRRRPTCARRSPASSQNEDLSRYVL